MWVAKHRRGHRRWGTMGAAEFSTRSTRSTRLIQNEERSSVYSVRERKRPFSVFCGKKKISAAGLAAPRHFLLKRLNDFINP